MQIKVDPVCVDILLKAAQDKELINHVRPGMSKISASAMVNAITYEFLKRWYEKKASQTNSN